MQPLVVQTINLLAAVLLLLAFAMLSQRRILSLIHLFTLQGVMLVAATALVAHATGQPHLYASAAITFVLKVILFPVLLHRLIDRLNIKWDVETLINVPTTMLVGIVLVIICLQSHLTDLSVLGIDCAQHTGHRTRERAALLHDDDYAWQSGAPGDRLLIDGERAFLRRDRGDVRYADLRGAWNRARRPGGDPDSRSVHVPDPRAVRQSRYPPPGEIEGRLMKARQWYRS
jgi:hypothetical protein